MTKSKEAIGPHKGQTEIIQKWKFPGLHSSSMFSRMCFVFFSTDFPKEDEEGKL